MKDPKTQTNQGLVESYQDLLDRLHEAVEIAKIEVDAAVKACEFVQAIAQMITSKAMADESWITDYDPGVPDYDPPEEIQKMQEDSLRVDLEEVLAGLIRRRQGLDFKEGALKAAAELEPTIEQPVEAAAASGIFVVDGKVYSMEVDRTAL